MCLATLDLELNVFFSHCLDDDCEETWEDANEIEDDTQAPTLPTFDSTDPYSV